MGPAFTSAFARAPFSLCNSASWRIRKPKAERFVYDHNKAIKSGVFVKQKYFENVQINNNKRKHKLDEEGRVTWIEVLRLVARKYLNVFTISSHVIC